LTLFSAFLPPADLVGAMGAERARHRAGGSADRRLRWSAPVHWHVTLGFFGADEPAARVDWLAGRLAGRPAPRVRLTGAGTFPGVLWLGVEGEGLAELAEAAGSGLEDRAYRPHLTLARFPPEEPAEGARWEQALKGFETEFWTVGEVVLMASEWGPGKVTESPYRVIERWPLH
jgi:2'-5' RNA ligase